MSATGPESAATGGAPGFLGAPPPPRHPYPAGTVAFLFTDIEGSTRLWEHQPGAMRRALARHNALMAAVVEAHGGVWFKTVGDAVQAAFPAAPAAIAAAADAQRALAAEPWDETGPLRVRMAVHAGAAEPVGGDYLAPCLNRLARLLATGYGGQVLLSDAARALLGGELPAGTSLRDLGSHRLRDLLEPERVWQVVLPGMPDTFPPLKSLERHPTNLPVQPTPLVGREADLAALLPRLRDPATRLLTLTGPGGAGKTRLALQLAADALDAFPDGAFFVDLAAVTDPALLPGRIGDALGVLATGGLSERDALQAFLAPKRLLMVLDNLEQFRPLAGAARAVADLLSAAPGLTVLATSRAPLRIRAEREWPLAGLPAPDPSRPLPPPVLAENPAVALFVARAQAAKPAFVVDETNAADVAELVARLDGLPLAIELAAARVRALAPIQILDRLDGRPGVLADRAPDRPDRHRTLEATIAWSHDLLPDAEQAFFRRLAVFSGGATLEAIEAVAGALGEPWLDPLDGITSLLEESLLRAEDGPDGETRYRMLETIRAFALARLTESGEEAAARAAHWTFFNDWAHAGDVAMVEGDAAPWLPRYEADHDNLRAALAWAIDHGGPGNATRLAAWCWKFWEYRGHLTEGRRWLDRALATDTGARPIHRAEALRGAGNLAWRQGDLRAAERLLRASLALWEDLGDRRSIASTSTMLGNVADHLGEAEQAATWHRRALDLACEMGDRTFESVSLNNLALLAHGRGTLAEARSLLEASLAIKEELGNRAGMAITLSNLALVSLDEGDPAAATALLERSLAIDRELGDVAGIADDLSNLAAIAAMGGDLAAAAARHHEALLLWRDLDAWLGIAHAIENIAATAANAQPGRAARLYGAAEKLRDELHAPIPGNERARYFEGVDLVRAALGNAACEAAWAAGRLLPREEIVAEALRLAAGMASIPDTEPDATGGSPVEASVETAG